MNRIRLNKRKEEQMARLYDFRIGQRVQSHPAIDFWMRGLRYGTVTKVGRKLIWVKFDNWDGVDKKISPANLIGINDDASNT